MKKKSLFFSGLGIALFVFVAMVFRPVPMNQTEAECELVEGTVTHIWEGGIKDVVFSLEESDKKFYINRGLENGLELEALKQQLIGERVQIYYPDYWTPLDPNDEVKHLSKLVHGEEVIYSELVGE
ncbi:MAG: hypothetical protein AAF806_16230 [Bacteroidota bacterium]